MANTDRTAGWPAAAVRFLNTTSMSSLRIGNATSVRAADEATRPVCRGWGGSRGARHRLGTLIPMPPVVPVILSGGAGTRLWPLSRHSAPKQLQRLLGPDTMLRSTIARVDSLDGRVVVVANVDTLDEIASEIPADRPRLLIGEPIGRNTAAAVAAAALLASPDEVLLVLPADHHVVDVAEFRHALDRAVEVAGQGRLVTFGVVPTRLETGFGYIVPASSPLDPALDARPIDRFVEKPEASAAADLIEAGALWNSGMFVFPVALLLEEMARHVPEVLEHVEEAVRSAVVARRHDRTRSRVRICSRSADRHCRHGTDRPGGGGPT